MLRRLSVMVLFVLLFTTYSCGYIAGITAVAVSGSGSSSSSSSAPNTAPVASVSSPVGVQSGDVTITYNLNDTEGDIMSVKVEFALGSAFVPASRKDGQGEDIANLTSGSHTFVWDSPKDVGTIQSNSIKIRITPSDGKEGISSTTAAFTISNSADQKASVTITTPALTDDNGNPANESGLVRILYKLIDPSSDVCSITAEYSTDLGESWKICSQGPGGFGVPTPGQAGANMISNLSSAPSASGGVDHVFEWDSFKDLPAGDTVVLFRITADDGTGPGSPGMSDQFRIDHSADRHKFDGSLTSMSTSRAGPAVGVVNNRIYALGGALTTTTFSNTVEEYNPFTNTWKNITYTGTFTARGYVASATINNKIYVIGGKYSGGSSNKVEIFDPSTNTFTEGADMPTARSGCAGAVANGFIYVMGGDTGLANTNKVEAYDSINNVWSTSFTSMPTLRTDVALAVAKRSGVERIYAIGGRTAGTAILTVDEYTPNADAWNSGYDPPDLPLTEDRFGASAFSVDNTVFVTGGQKAIANYLSTSHYFSPGGTSWTSTNSLPSSRVFASSVTFLNKIYILGGEATGELSTAKNDSFEGGRSSFRSLTPMAIAKDGPVAAVSGDKLYALAGNTTSNEEYDFWQGTWQTKAAVPGGLINFDFAGALASDGTNTYIYLFGTKNPNSDTSQKYNIATGAWSGNTTLPWGTVIMGWAETIGGIIYLFGFQARIGSNTINGRFDPVSATYPVFAGGSYDNSNFGECVFKHNGVEKIYIAGKYNAFGNGNEFYIWDAAAGSPTVVAYLPYETGGTRRFYTYVAGMFGKIFVFGGDTNPSGGSPRQEVFKYDIDANKFEGGFNGSSVWVGPKEPLLPTARARGKALGWNKKIFLVGGKSGGFTLSGLLEFRP